MEVGSSRRDSSLLKQSRNGDLARRVRRGRDNVSEGELATVRAEKEGREGGWQARGEVNHRERV